MKWFLSIIASYRCKHITIRCVGTVLVPVSIFLPPLWSDKTEWNTRWKNWWATVLQAFSSSPMWREEAEHTTREYYIYNRQSTTASRSIHDRILNCCFLRLVIAPVLSTSTYYWSYSCVITWQIIELLLSAISSTCTTYYVLLELQWCQYMTEYWTVAFFGQ